MKQKALVVVLAASLLVIGGLARGQQARTMRRIGFLSPATRIGHANLAAAFLGGLRELGYVDGQNIEIEYRWADGKFDRLPELAADLVRLKVEVIVTLVTQASLAAKNATETIPIVMVAVGNPVDAG